MKKVKYKGYIVSQAENNHVMITKDDEIFHAQCNKKLTAEGLKKRIENYIKLKDLINKVFEND